MAAQPVANTSKVTCDVWLMFGMFAYAFEAILLDGNFENILVTVSDLDTTLAKQLQEILLSPKGLLRAEIRIYAEHEAWVSITEWPPIWEGDTIKFSYCQWLVGASDWQEFLMRRERS